MNKFKQLVNRFFVALTIHDLEEAIPLARYLATNYRSPPREVYDIMDLREWHQ